MNNGWTEERKQRQAQLIRQWQPWTKSTGAKTSEGKKRSSMNAFKDGGAAQQELQRLKLLLREQKQYIVKLAHI